MSSGILLRTLNLNFKFNLNNKYNQVQKTRVAVRTSFYFPRLYLCHCGLRAINLLARLAHKYANKYLDRVCQKN